MTVQHRSGEKLITSLVRRLTLEQKVRLVSGADTWRTHDEPAIGLTPIVLSDGPLGVRGTLEDERDPSICLPSPTALAATWDETTVARLAELLAAEARRKGVHVVLGPTLNLHRSPLGGRNFECFSEDPLLTARMGRAYVQALQSFGIAACPKHYVANDSETERFTVDVQVDDRTLREVYLAPFEHAVAAGAWMVMSAYNSVNGHTMTENPLVEEPLKGAWGFDGAVVSDWLAIRSTIESGTSATDLAMPGPSAEWGTPLCAAVRAGQVPEAAIDEKVRRILRLAGRVGALESVEPARRRDPEPVNPASLLREAAADGMVLLRNEGGLLPIEAGELRRVAIIGQHALTPQVQGGGSAQVIPVRIVSPVDGIRTYLGSAVNVTHRTGVHVRSSGAPADLELLTNPVSGEAGVRVRYLDQHGDEMRVEDRHTATVTVTRDVLGGVDTVEMRTRLRARVDGVHSVGVAGRGTYRNPGLYRVLVADEVVSEEAIEQNSYGQPGEQTLAPPVDCPLTLVSGEEVDVVVQHRLAPGVDDPTVTLAVAEPTPSDDGAIADAVAAAAQADVAVVIVGTNEHAESEGFDRASLKLPGRQDDLVRAVAAANPRTVVVVNSGAPVELPWDQDAPAVLLAWFPGQEFGDALADVLFGAREPGGRLPTTWPSRETDAPILQVAPRGGMLDYAEGLNIGYRAWAALGDPPPAYPFGHGLGYTNWEYHSVKAAKEIRPGEPTTVHVRLSNTGQRAGKEVVQVYLQRLDSAIARPALWLAGFSCVWASAGEELEVEIVVAARAFEHWRTTQERWATESGEYRLLIGGSSIGTVLEETVVVL
jgi:beta-glucosidase